MSPSLISVDPRMPLSPTSMTYGPTAQMVLPDAKCSLIQEFYRGGPPLPMTHTEVRFKSLRRPLLGGLMGGGCLKVGRATG